MTNEITNEELQQLKAAALAATPGPWDFDTAETPFRIAGGEVVGGDELPYGDVYTTREYETPDGPECLIIASEIGVDNGRYLRSANPATILALIAKVESLAADAERWISVNDRLPEKYEEVMVFPWPTDYCMTAERDDKGFYYGEYVHNHGHENERIAPGRITHWMPLPNPPTTKE